MRKHFLHLNGLYQGSLTLLTFKENCGIKIVHDVGISNFTYDKSKFSPKCSIEVIESLMQALCSYGLKTNLHKVILRNDVSCPAINVRCHIKSKAVSVGFFQIYVKVKQKHKQ